MINGTHVLFYSADPTADRTFFRDVLAFRSVDVGGGWLIFALPPAEAAFHPIGDTPGQTHSGHQMLGAAIYLMCDNLAATVKELAAKHVRCTEIATENWGIRTTVALPSGGEVGLYQPTHPTALNLE
jgi:hypothetical protein